MWCLCLSAATAQDSADRQPPQSRIAPAKSEQPAWKGAFVDSLRLLTMEHLGRIAFQEKTRRELGGNFFGDYVRSLKVPKTWGDSDRWPINYIGHPIHGAAAGYIWLDHEDRSHDHQLFSAEYWASRWRATGWANMYSLQFEFGPFSEASIGNVGLNPETTGWSDHVMTPVGAFGFIVAEDVLDRYVVSRLETKVGNRVSRAIVRTALNPSRSLSNIAQGRWPWFRAGRSLQRVDVPRGPCVTASLSKAC